MNCVDGTMEHGRGVDADARAGEGQSDFYQDLSGPDARQNAVLR